MKQQAGVPHGSRVHEKAALTEGERGLTGVGGKLNGESLFGETNVAALPKTKIRSFATGFDGALRLAPAGNLRVAAVQA